MIHPAQRFAAPSTIQHGVPLKELMSRELIALIAESFAAVCSEFDTKRFRAAAARGLDDLELTPQAQHIARALGEQLPADFDDVAPLLIVALGPELPTTEGNGLVSFFYLPHAHVIADRGLNHFKSVMLANDELTKRFTTEFSIRPFLIEHRAACLRLLTNWISDSYPHVRRLASEGTRPRLPLAMRLREFQANPRFTLPLLERLKDDPDCMCDLRLRIIWPTSPTTIVPLATASLQKRG